MLDNFNMIYYVSTEREVALMCHFHALQDPHVPLSMSVQHKFIAFAGYLHHKGLATLVADIYKAVEFVLRGYVLVDFSYKRECTYFLQMS